MKSTSVLPPRDGLVFAAAMRQAIGIISYFPAECKAFANLIFKIEKAKAMPSKITKTEISRLKRKRRGKKNEKRKKRKREKNRSDRHESDRSGFFFE